MKSDDKNPQPADKATTKRRPYEPPAIRREEQFETVAAGCTQFTKTACGAGFQAS
jgi:hypothetical protein